jgi:hypothetical protein
MKRRELNSYDIAKRLKLAKKRKPSDFALYLKDPSSFEFMSGAKKREAARALLPPVPIKKQKDSNYQNTRAAALDKIKSMFPPEIAAAMRKKRRRTYRLTLSTIEYDALVWYIKSCKRSRPGRRRPHRSLKAANDNNPRQRYENYINSPQWESVKNRYYQTHPRRCAACNTASRIHLHHMYYGNFGCEQDNDLIPLCNTHHDQYHRENGTQRNMLQRTMTFIDKIRAGLAVAA